tara:strand:+ start:3601 stop:3990 length:390 start_codon:yes stop_codon:yes gene_type:complete
MSFDLKEFSKKDKPWGYEQIWAKSSDKGGYVAKVIFIKKGHRLSLQYHEKKEETILVISGTLFLDVGKEFNHQDTEGVEAIKLSEGEVFHIRPMRLHRFCAENTDVTLIEVSTHFLKDVVRVEDDYGRA